MWRVSKRPAGEDGWSYVWPENNKSYNSSDEEFLEADENNLLAIQAPMLPKLIAAEADAKSSQSKMLCLVRFIYGISSPKKVLWQWLSTG